MDGPGLPADVLRMIWQRVWRDDAARLVQRAVRAKVVRARGDLWNLPGLVAPDDLFMWDMRYRQMRYKSVSWHVGGWTGPANRPHGLDARRVAAGR